ncbi:CRAL-TRIO domain-containing protein [Trametes gibbosa]|nr:CRAL-TRIO domain-containing protein [Trametes gibbosa]
MSVSATYEALLVQQELFVEAYEKNVEGARSIQRTLLQDILPGMVDELGLEDEDVKRAELWLGDLQSVFRVFRRHKFTAPFALEQARDVLLWRLAVIPVVIPPCPSPFLFCLPRTSRDPFRRPFIVIKLAKLFEYPGDVREALVHYVELLRVNLEVLNAAADEEDGVSPVLQYVALLDIGGLSVQSVSTDLLSWYVLELVPRFPGMLAATFILNYSWAHSGVWKIVKRVLPKSALSRVFFPSREELVQVISPSALPQDYGGSLAPLSQLEDPLENLTARPAKPRPSSPSQPSSSRLPPPDEAKASRICRVPSISPTSHLNPYFGYPVSGRDAATPRLRHGRQRKRDLLRTLATLWWDKWKGRVYVLLCIGMAIVMVTSRRRPLILRWKQALRGLRGSLPPPRGG